MDDCEKLSITARCMIALLVFERFCAERHISHPEISRLADYLWEWPSVQESGCFETWEKSKTALVCFGLGDAIPKDLLETLTAGGVGELGFRELVAGVVEILWGSFWGAAEDDQSFNALRRVIARAEVSSLPPITPFRFSRFSEGGGWGLHSAEDHGFWRSLRGYA